MSEWQDMQQKLNTNLRDPLQKYGIVCVIKKNNQQQLAEE